MKKNNGIKYVFIVLFILLIFNILTRNKIEDNKSEKEIDKYEEQEDIEIIEYDMEKTINELNLKTDEDYYKYLEYLKNMMYPEELKIYIDVDDYVKRIREAEYSKKTTMGSVRLKNFYSHAYACVIDELIKKETSWDDLPLTENFRKKFNEQEGIIKEVDDYYPSLGEFELDDKFGKFNISRYWIADDAYEKYTKEQVEFMLEDGAGAYNLDRYNYRFILDENGYVDDIVFEGITPIVVEGRDLLYD